MDKYNEVSILYTLALISDVHSNLTALEAVLNDMTINYPEIKEIYFIGDLCGYGPDPKECAELILKNKIITKLVKGNHDHYIGQGITPPPTNPLAVSSINWQITQIPLELRWEIAQLPQLITTRHLDFSQEICLVHGSPQYPLTEYIHANSKKQENLFDYMVNLGIDILVLGHTHIPFIQEKIFSDKKLIMVNPGSIGQPRDENPKASYMVIDLNKMDAKIIRVDYLIDSVVNRLNEYGLPKLLGERLFLGR